MNPCRQKIAQFLKLGRCFRDDGALVHSYTFEAQVLVHRYEDEREHAWLWEVDPEGTGLFIRSENGTVSLGHKHVYEIATITLPTKG